MRTAPPLPAVLAAGLLASACAPQVARLPTPGVQAGAWSSAALPAPPRRHEAEFWTTMGPPALPGLIERALAANPSLDVALARIVQARGSAREAGAALSPQIGLSAGASARETQRFNTAQYSTAGASAGLDISWEADLFGGLRAGRRAAADRYRAAGLDAQATAQLVVAEVARTLLQLSAIDDRAAILDRSIANARRTLDLIDLRIEEGAAQQAERGTQAIELRRLEADRTRLIEARRTTESALAVLVGAEPVGFTVPRLSLAAWKAPAIALGQPADLVTHRPDIRAAEARIAAFDGDIDQARAAFLPRLRLSGTGLAQAATLGGPVGWTLSAAAGLTAPIFAGGRLKGQLESATGRQQESVAAYRQALLGALKEVVDALAQAEGAGSRGALFGTALTDARRAAGLTRERYREGETDLSAVLDAERGALAVEDGAALAQQERIAAAIDLYRALGGAPLPIDPR